MLLQTEHLFTVASSVSIFLVVYLVATVFVLPFFSSKARYLDSHTWIGLQKQWFSRFRAGVASVSETRALVVEGYDKFSKNGQNWIMPRFLSDPILMLPVDKVQEIANASDELLDETDVNAESTAPDYTHGRDVAGGPHIDIIRNQLTRRLPLLTTDVHEELALAMEQNWKPKAEWTTIKAYESCMKVVSQAANRVFCGAELCRNPEFLEQTRLFAINTFMTGSLLKLVPTWLHPIAGPLVALPVTRALAACKRIAVPVMEERVRNMLDPELAKDYKPPTDALQWMLEEVVQRARTNPKELNMDLNVRRLMILNMVAIHTTSMVTTNTLLDMYTHPEADMYIEGLREECERVLAAYDGKWTKEALNQLIRVDSVIRESMRLSTLADFGMLRQVKSKSGITLKDGTHIPHGVRIAFGQYSIHQDPALYSNGPSTWEGFRFSAPREGNAPTDLSTVLAQKNRSMTATSPEYLAFGLGRHACPGRFFASQEMKLMLAHIVLNYDIKVVGGVRPPNDNLGGASVPSEKTELQIRLRQK